jgi:hypothetical protein
MADPGARLIQAEELAGGPKPITARAQQEPLVGEIPKGGVTYHGKCRRCDQDIRLHIKGVDGTCYLMNFYDVRCACKGRVGLYPIGPASYQMFAHLDPQHPSNRRLEATPE